MTNSSPKQKQSDDFFLDQNVEMHPGPVDPCDILDQVYDLIKRCIVCDDEVAIAATLWIAFTWFIDEFKVAPIAMITAPEKRCGKTLLLELLGKLVRRPLPASNITAAAMFRAIDKWAPTLLIDEADAFMNDNEELRGVINSGHGRSSAFTIRTVGPTHEPKQFSTWCAKVISGIGTQASTIMDRSIILKLRRKTNVEKVERLRHIPDSTFLTIKSKLLHLSVNEREGIESQRVSLPDQLNDRAQDNWEPLFLIASLAGDKWISAVRTASLILNAEGESNGSRGVDLLTDVKTIFGLKEKLTAKEMVDELSRDDEMAWSTYNRGSPITVRQVIRILNEFGLRTKQKRPTNQRFYFRLDFEDVWNRYLQPENHDAEGDFSVFSSDSKSLGVTPVVTQECVSHVTPLSPVTIGQTNQLNLLTNQSCNTKSQSVEGKEHVTTIAN